MRTPSHDEWSSWTSERKREWLARDRALTARREAQLHALMMVVVPMVIVDALLLFWFFI